MNQELTLLFDEDQQECLNQPPDSTPEHKAMRMRIKARIAKVQAIIESATRLSGEDYFYACIIFLHGDCPEDFWQAYTCALKSVELQYAPARKLAAAAYDRWLMYQGKPQKYGLQYVPDGTRLRVWDVDPQTTDAERADWDVPPLEELYEHAQQLTKTYDLSKIDMHNKPQWLKDAIKRWQAEENSYTNKNH
ncbi:hypothetical protein Q0590_16250 [Rhodocytophaga aerolata]|uniref:Uncharacterized protein n=1 Tax=Rhodocytophaga aerolata TaxID=455078 RepID=A0ABT8R6U7_9BACT|nr:hypothetical protein [Rhodocytophaga aerolata]MDO1447824.1 hypothetical protein [Rhodocytophaga aerolata]